MSLISHSNVMHLDLSMSVTRCHNLVSGVKVCQVMRYQKVSQGNKRCHMAEGTSKWLFVLFD